MEIELRRVFNAPKEKVFEALTNSEIIKQWSSGDAILAPESGGRYEMFDKWICGVIEEIEKDKKLVYTWECTDFSEDQPPTKVRYELLDHPKGTELHLIHSGFTDPEQYENHKKSWEDQFFGPMETYIKNN